MIGGAQADANGRNAAGDGRVYLWRTNHFARCRGPRGAGHLDNNGETIELKFPDQPEPDGFASLTQVEKVTGRPIAPRPARAVSMDQSNYETQYFRIVASAQP